MVVLPFLIRLVMLVAILSGCSKADPPVRLCFSTVAAFGQQLQALYCGQDSCYLMDFAAGHAGASAGGLFSAPVDRDTLLKGDSLILAFMKIKLPTMKHGSTSFSVRRNDSEIAMPRHPQTDAFLPALKAWVDNRKAETRAHRQWRDSLVLAKTTPGSRDIEIRLTSAYPPGMVLGEPKLLRIVHTLSPSVDPETLEPRKEFPVDSILPLLSGIPIKYRVPVGVESVEAILRVSSVRNSPSLPAVCLEGVFELVSEPLVIGGE